MTTYRAFLVDDQGHFVGVHILEGCQADADAISAGKRYVDVCAVQIWNLDRVVAKINQNGTVERPPFPTALEG